MKSQSTRVYFSLGLESQEATEPQTPKRPVKQTRDIQLI